jgi:hypothetical protein
MDNLLLSMSGDMVRRLDGPLHFRFIFQPCIAIIFAIRDGRKDAREGRVPYFWALFTEPGRCKELIQNGWKSVGKIFILALILDFIYQVWQLHWFYPGQALVVAIVLAIIPYLLLRGPVNRLTRHRKQGETYVHKVVSGLPR